MVRAIAAGAWAYIKRVSEIVPEAITKSAHFKPSQKAPVAEVAELANCDTIIVGTRTRFERMSSQMVAFLDQASGLWARGAFNGKVGVVFTST
jgi:NAD(P)H dehydrogenase (quinone)